MVFIRCLTAKDQQISENIKIIGIALTIPPVLVAGPLLGYGVATVLIQKGFPSFVLPLCIGMGSILALVQTFRTIKLLQRIQEKL